MAKSVNKVILLGNVGKDPEIRSTPNGVMVANFTLATSDRYQDSGGNWPRTAPSGTTWSPSSAPPKSSATTSKRAPNSTSKAGSRPAAGTTRRRAPKSIAPRLSCLTSRCSPAAKKAPAATAVPPAPAAPQPTSTSARRRPRQVPRTSSRNRPRSPTTTSHFREPPKKAGRLKECRLADCGKTRAGGRPALVGRGFTGC